MPGYIYLIKPKRPRDTIHEAEYIGEINGHHILRPLAFFPVSPCPRFIARDNVDWAVEVCEVTTELTFNSYMAAQKERFAPHP